MADHEAKASLSLHKPIISEETRFLGPVLHTTCPQTPALTNAPTNVKEIPPAAPPHVDYKIPPLKVFQKILDHPVYKYTFTSSWHSYLFHSDVWLSASSSVLFSTSHCSLRKYMVQNYGRTLPTFHQKPIFLVP
jgi:hypothetical protein